MPANTRKYQQAVELLRLGQFERCVEALLQMQRVEQTDPAICASLAEAFTGLGQFDRAIYYYEKQLSLQPTESAGAIGIVHVLTLALRKQEAIDRGAELAKRFGNDPRFVLFYSTALLNAGRPEETEIVIRKALASSGDDAALSCALGSVLLNLGRAREAETVLRETLKSSPQNPNAQILLASALNYLPGTDWRESLELHRSVGRFIESQYPVIDPLSFENPPDVDRVIRVGILSSDLRGHAVSRFVDAILRHHDRGRVHLTGFHVFATDDEVTREFEGLCDGWRAFRANNPRVIAQEIWNQKIDVLVELGGLSGNSVLMAMVPRVAPVQVSCIGYPNTTGVNVIDFRIVDACTDPPGESDKRCVETLVRLDPCFLCYTPSAAGRGREVARSPGEKNGFVTFGSFNKSTKITDEVLAVWSQILARVPDSRLLLKTSAFGSKETCVGFSRRLAAAGISVDRVDLEGFVVGDADHLATYNRVDIALDTFPYNGTTTTCDALLMGVPVIALEGELHAGRVGVSLLHAAGMGENLARTTEEYVEKASALAQDQTRLKESRAAVRAKFLASPLCDGPAYAMRWEAAIRQMWRAWCVRKARGA